MFYFSKRLNAWLVEFETNGFSFPTTVGEAFRVGPGCFITVSVGVGYIIGKELY